MSLERGSGVLLHPTSLPGMHGIGDFGSSADRFLDYLDRADIKYWQLLPLGPVNSSGSPYQTLSSFAGNTLLISLEKLADLGLLTKTDIMGCHPEDEAKVAYQEVKNFKSVRLKVAFANFLNHKDKYKKLHVEFEEFKKENKGWLDDYALFSSIKEYYNEQAWWQWEDNELVCRDEEALLAAREKFSAEIEMQSWLQFIFFRQWLDLKKRFNEKGIKLIGDLPIYTAHDSADVWAEREFFEVDPETGEALLMAGAPPDYFCEDGQLWGNPIYKWDLLKDNGYEWWMRRMKATLKLTDIVRIDHFRGFEAYWQVDAGEETARDGKWIKGPGQDFFDALMKEFGFDKDKLPFIAEDLGVITPEVDALRDDNFLPGMKILQFAFCQGANMYRPHTYEKKLCRLYWDA